MATITPHRDAVEAALAQMLQADAALPPPETAAGVLERRATKEFTATLLRAYADARDQDVSPKHLFMIVQSAVGNGMTALTGTMAQGDSRAAEVLTIEMLNAAAYHCLERLRGKADYAVKYAYTDEPVRGRA